MSRVRRCGSRCHNARGTRCQCWCGGFFHGKDGAGAANRESLIQNAAPVLAQAGFKEGETAYIEQKRLPLELPPGDKDHG